jgi:hypothetical protein
LTQALTEEKLMSNLSSFSKYGMGLLLALAMACGGGGGGGSSPSTINPNYNPTIIAQPVSQTVTVGQTATFTVVATGTGGQLSYQWIWNDSSGNSLGYQNGSSSSYITPPTVLADTDSTCYVVVTNNVGNSGYQVNSNTVTLSVTPASAAPTITSFTANPTSITSGQSSTLSWSVSGATSLSVNQGVGAVSGTSVEVSPTATITYTLTASNATGNTTATATVNITPAGSPTITSFSANPTTISSGQSSTLSWAVTGATGLSINQGVGTVTGTSKSVSPTTTTTYTLTATNAAGSNTATATVTVSSSANFTGNFLAWTGPSAINPSYPFELIRINGTTGAITAIGGQDNFNGLGYGLNGDLYGISDHLAIINPATGATSNPVNLTYEGGSPILMCAASFSPSGTLYVLEDVSPGRIFTVNLTTGALTLVGTAPGAAETIGFGSGGTLYAGFNELYTLSTSNAAIVKDIGSLGYSPFVNVIALSAGAGGTLYAMDWEGACVYSINPTVPSATVVANVGGNASEWITAFVAEQ